MSTTESQGETKKNQQAIASLILGILSIVFALGNFLPGLFSILSCVGATAALLAFPAGILGLRAARKLDGQGRGWAIAGMSLGGLGLLVFIAVIGFTMAFYTQMADKKVEAVLTLQSPQVFRGDGFTLTYPASWQTLDIRQQDFCKQPNIECLMTIAPSPSDGTNINVIRLNVNLESTVEEIDQALWTQLEANSPDVVLESRKTIEVGGQPAIKRTFNIPSPQAANGRAHLQQIYIAKGLALYQLTVWAPSADALTQYQAEIEAITKSLQFTP